MAEYFGMRLVGDFYSLPTVKGHALLIHGDQLCLSDRKYDSFKRFSSNPIMQYLFLSLPISWRNKIGKNIRAKSMAKNHATTSRELLNSPIVKEVGKRFLEPAKSLSGTVKCDFPSSVVGDQYTYGDGSTKISLKTSSGKVHAFGA